ncbi:flagellar biosynthesis protein, FliO [Psychromonas sp. PRT-SC03]|nr:flagellar biosynthesis protein, FliO [Psychromonas sp. PRT-SC03]
MIRLLILLCAFYPLSSGALEMKSPQPELSLSTLFGSLLLVIACIFLFAYLIKKTNLLKNKQNKNALRILATQSLNRKGQVQLIELNGQQYLLGVTEQNITLLDKYETPIVAKEALPNNVNSPFSILLSKMSKKNNEK